MRLILITFLILSCGNNVTEQKVENHKKKIIEWETDCENYREVLEKISQFNYTKNENKQNIIEERIEDNSKKLKSKIKGIIRKNKTLDDFNRSYSKVDIFFNRINKFYYTVIGDQKKVEMYEFERIWFLPKTKETNYMGYSQICTLEVPN